jgi:hypothetical protein
MIEASECRAKAHDALTSAASETVPGLRLDWETMAEQWCVLADRLDAQEASRRDFIGRISN